MAKQAFAAFDKDNSGSVDVNEFLQGLRVSLYLCRSVFGLILVATMLNTPFVSSRIFAH
jgi:Ca2+-binding EF-hand superfamily protein